MGGVALALVLCLAATTAIASRGSNSHVPGAAFDRIFQVWLENGNYDVRPPITPEGGKWGRRGVN